MTLAADIERLQAKCSELADRVDTLESRTDRTVEQVGGERGLSAAINALSAEVTQLRKDTTHDVGQLRKAAYWVAGILVASSIGFAFSVLVFIAPQ